MPTHDDAEECAARAEMIRPYLAGIGSEKQGAVLVELVATWLAGHMAANSRPGDPATENYRRVVFGVWVDAVWQMVPINEMIMREEHGLPTEPWKGN